MKIYDCSATGERSPAVGPEAWEKVLVEAFVSDKLSNGEDIGILDERGC